MSEFVREPYSETELEEIVALLRHAVSEAQQESGIVWEHTGDGEYPYQAEISGRRFTIRVNDFPAEPLYTLFVEGIEVEDLEDWPATWVRPETPQALLDMVERTTDSKPAPGESPPGG